MSYENTTLEDNGVWTFGNEVNLKHATPHCDDCEAVKTKLHCDKCGLRTLTVYRTIQPQPITAAMVERGRDATDGAIDTRGLIAEILDAGINGWLYE